jgi:Periplasmic serine proteases (ClpP class)
MPGWDDIMTEINQDPFHAVRKKQINRLFELTNRNIICYYSAFLTKKGDGMSIDDSDIVGFMSSIKEMEDKTVGLDLVLHTPGGNPTATEAIVNYLRSIFGTDIRVIVPQIAMSAGTMVACAGKEIVMGKQSSLGPIDPQIGGTAALNIKKVFDDAKSDLAEHPENAPYWQMQFRHYPPALIYDCINAINLSSELVTGWLSTAMFLEDSNRSECIKGIVSYLNQNEDSKIHSRHFDIEKCKSFGLKIVALEDDHEFQDAVLSVHHAYMALLANTPVVKIIENQFAKSYMVNQNPPPIN